MFNGYGKASGYGVEFDTWLSPDEDPSDNHIALIKDSVHQHLASRDNSEFNNFEWHQVKIDVGRKSVVVALDGMDVLNWRGEIFHNKTHLGFGAATGGNTAWHIIDDVHIKFECPVGGEIQPPSTLTAAIPLVAVFIAAVALYAGILYRKKLS